jgi:feruloyl esterase
MAVPMAHGVTRYPGFGVTGDEDGERYQYTFYTVGTDQPSHPLEPGRGFERGRGAILNFAALLIRHTIVQDSTFDPYLFDPRPYGKRIQYLSGSSTRPIQTFRDSAREAEGHHSPAVCGQCGRNADGRRILQQRRREARSTGHRRRAPLFVAPGGGHNVTRTSQVDVLTLLIDWVEKDRRQPIRDRYDIDPVDLKTVRTMPACRYRHTPIQRFRRSEQRRELHLHKPF